MDHCASSFLAVARRLRRAKPCWDGDDPLQVVVAAHILDQIRRREAWQR
jgi:hypothetical protein